MFISPNTASHVCVAAAGVTVGDFVAELDIPIPGLDEVQPWIPKLNVGGDSSGENTALQVSLLRGGIAILYTYNKN